MPEQIHILRRTAKGVIRINVAHGEAGGQALAGSALSAPREGWSRAELSSCSPASDGDGFIQDCVITVTANKGNNETL